jgi:hypothetical protein
MSICPAASFNDCCCPRICNERRLCARLHYAPIDAIDAVGQTAPMAVHFVGFRGEEYHLAVKAFGLTDFIHKIWDRRAVTDVSSIDLVVFGKYHDCEPSIYSFDDSNQSDDHASSERIS